MPQTTDVEMFVMVSLLRKKAGLAPYQCECWGTGEQSAPVYASPYRFTREQAIADARRWLAGREIVESTR